MTPSFEQIRAMVEDAIRQQYPPVARGEDEPYEGACRFYVTRIWTDRALVRRSYYSLESDPHYGLVPYTTKESEGGNWAVSLDAMIPMKIQAVSDDGKTSVELETKRDEGVDISEAGKRNSKADAKSLNAAMRALMGLIGEDDLDEDTMDAMKKKMMAKPMDKAMKGSMKKTHESSSDESDVSEAWSGMDGETITETLTCVIEGTFDKKNMVIKDHVVLGPLSKNGYRYPVATQEAAIKAKIFEGAKAYLNHPRSKEMGDARDVRDLIGEHKNVRLNGEKTYSDLFLVNNRTVQDHVLPIAESAPHLIGSSVVIRGKMKRVEGDLPEIEAIYACRSIDLVSEPATTNGLYESEKTEKVEEDMELKDLTLEQLRTRPDLIEAVLAGAKEKEKVVELEAQLAESAKKLEESEKKRVAAELKEAKTLLDNEIVSLVREAKIPDSIKYEEKDGKKEIKSHLSGILQRCESSDERRQVIADWEEVYKTKPPEKKVVPVVVSPEQKLDFDGKPLTTEAISGLYKSLTA